MKRRIAIAMLFLTACTPIRQSAAQSAAQSGGTVELGRGWQRITDPATLGYSRTTLDSVLAIAKSMKTSALLVTVGGRSLLEYGDLTDTSYIASARKSILSMLHWKYVENGTIRLNETLAEIGIDDLGGLLPLERTATVEHLLGARSGVYHAASNPGDALVMAPVRGSQKPGTYNLYSNWGLQRVRHDLRNEDGAQHLRCLRERHRPAHRAAPAAGMVGEFEMSPGSSLKITLENGHLQSEQTGSAKQPLVYVSRATYAVGRADGPITLTFTVGANGRATAVVLRENGNERTLPRQR